MLTPLERVNNLIADLRYAQVDFDALFAGKNSLTPLESVELFLAEQQRLRVLKQNLLRRKRANLPAEKTLDSFDFGFQRSVSREQMLRLSDMTWVEQAFNICFLGPPGVGKTHLALSLAVQGLDLGYSVAFETLDNLMTILKTEPFPKKRTQKVKKKWNDSRGIRYRWLCSGAEKIILKTRGRNPTQSRVRAEGVVEDFQIGKDIALRRRSGWIVF